VNTKDLAVQISQALSPCLSCGEFIDCWPEADPSEPGLKVVYIARDALFVGMCPSGHINEFHLAEAKAGEFVAHDVTERTLGRFVPQSECTHEKHVFAQVPSGQTVPGIDGMIVGPKTVKYCGLCGMRKVHVGKEA